VINKSLGSANLVSLFDRTEFCGDLDDSRSNLIRSLLIDDGVPSGFLYICLLIGFVDENEGNIVVSFIVFFTILFLLILREMSSIINVAASLTSILGYMRQWISYKYLCYSQTIV
jgi:hypothetical protein